LQGNRYFKSMNESILIVEDEFIVASDLADMVTKAGYLVCAIADTVQSAKKAVDEHQPAWVLLDIFLQDGSMGTELAPYLQDKGIGFIYISANTNQSILEAATATRPYGFLVKPFREKELLLMLEIARGKHQSIMEFSEQGAALLQQGLWALTDEMIPYDIKLKKMPTLFQPLVPFDVMTYRFQTPNHEKTFSGAFVRVGYDEYQMLPAAEIHHSGTLARWIEEMKLKCDSSDAELFSSVASHAMIEGITGISKSLAGELQSTLQFFTTSTQGQLQLGFYHKNIQIYERLQSKLLSKSHKAIFSLFILLSAPKSVSSPNGFRRAERIPSIKTARKFEGIVGSSATLLHVLDQVELVAGTNVCVLILGESGTGKEKIAHNLHQLSSRSSKPFVTVNCAAMPADLIESELFGHEAGSFTGANEKRIGKFEAAHGGTIFLDEIGELPLESQVKLLRVLQEKQVEHIGSSKTINVDVRIVAATNRNLEKEVGEGRFRLDLFYRLNVYPVTMPPLRERGADIILLAKHFLNISAVNIGKPSVPELSPFALKQLTEHHWPGNIRELEHLMERTVIQSKSLIINNVELKTGNLGPSSLPQAAKTLQQIEIEHILSVLNKCNGKINGSGGAAEILGLPASTLTSKMKKLGIKKTSNYNF
jgi:DNA-binding NtrC family response regulator